MEIKKSKAKESFNLEGKKLSSGKVKSRIHIGDDERFALSAKKISPEKKDSSLGFFKKHRYVRVSIANETYDVNINSIAKRLHLSRKEVQKMAENGDALKYLENRVQELTPLIDCYVKYFEKYGMNRRLLEKATELKTHQLMGLIRTSFEYQSENKTQEFTYACRTWQVMRNQKKNRYKIFERTRRLGQGEYGEVLQVKPLTNAKKEFAYKGISQENIEDSLKGIQNELAIQEHIETNQSLDGLIKRDETIVGLPHKKRAYGDGILMPLAQTFKAVAELSIGEKMEIAHQLLQAGRNLEILKIIHFDIKADNLLFFEENGHWRVELADFGGSSFQNRDTNTVNIEGFTVSPFASDYNKLLPLKERQLKHENEISYTPDLHQIDLFSMGVLFYELFSEKEFDEDVIPCNRHGFPMIGRLDVDKFNNNLAAKGVSVHMQNLILNMLQQNEQSSFDRTLNEFEVFIKT